VTTGPARRAQMNDEELGKVLGTLWADASFERAQALIALEDLEEVLVMIADYADEVRARVDRAFVNEERVIKFVTKCIEERRAAREERAEVHHEAVAEEIQRRGAA
jgi:hypothetical protein